MRLPRFVRQGPAKRATGTRASFETDDHWDGGVDYAPSELENNDDDLALFLTSNTSFLASMISTAAFTES